jgi:hypothetical protein
VRRRTKRALHHRQYLPEVVTKQDTAHGRQRQASHLLMKIDGSGQPSPPPLHDLLGLLGHGRGDRLPGTRPGQGKVVAEVA